MKIAAHTLGCKVNQYDTEAMLELFEKAGYESVSMNDDADVYLINTCTVTGTGDQKSVKLIRRIHREHPQAHIIAAGCLTQRDAKRVMLDGVLLAIGVQNRAKVVELYEEAVRTNTSIDATASVKGAKFECLSVMRHEGKTRATMKIQEGCDRFCTYCIILMCAALSAACRLKTLKRKPGALRMRVIPRLWLPAFTWAPTVAKSA